MNFWSSEIVTSMIFDRSPCTSLARGASSLKGQGDESTLTRCFRKWERIAQGCWTFKIYIYIYIYKQAGERIL